MIELLEGVPGSGKSYYSVAEYFLPHLRAGRRMYVYLDGIFFDKLSLFTGIPVGELEKQITVWSSVDEVLSSLPKVDPGSFVLIDEAQTCFRAMERVDKSLSRWLETHRHYGVDILLLCQDYRQMSQSITRLVEGTIKFRKLGFVGLKNHYQGKVRGNPDDTTEMRKITGKYDSSVYAYYSSYSSAAINELRRPNSIWKNAGVVVGMLGLLFAAVMFTFRPWTSLAEAPKKPVATVGLAAVPAERVVPVPALDQQPKVTPRLYIIGSGGRRGKYYYFLENGRMMTAQEIATKYGIAVSEEKLEGGFFRLIGEGVEYGPSSD